MATGVSAQAGTFRPSSSSLPRRRPFPCPHRRRLGFLQRLDAHGSNTTTTHHGSPKPARSIHTLHDASRFPGQPSPNFANTQSAVEEVKAGIGTGLNKVGWNSEIDKLIKTYELEKNVLTKEKLLTTRHHVCKSISEGQLSKQLPEFPVDDFRARQDGGAYKQPLDLARRPAVLRDSSSNGDRKCLPYRNDHTDSRRDENNVMDTPRQSRSSMPHIDEITFKRMANEVVNVVCESVSVGKITKQVPEYPIDASGAIQEGGVYEHSSDLSGPSPPMYESNANGSRKFLPSRNNHYDSRREANDVMDTPRQSGSSMPQTDNEGIQPNVNGGPQRRAPGDDHIGSKREQTAMKGIHPNGHRTGDQSSYSCVNWDTKKLYPRKKQDSRRDHTAEEGIHPNGFLNTNVNGDSEKFSPRKKQDDHPEEHRKKLVRIYNKVLVVDNIKIAKAVVLMLTTKYKNFIHACDTEVASIDVKQETPVDHGEIICFSIFSGSQADFGDGKSGIWVDVLDGGRDVLMEFTPFFEDSSIKKVWHNYSFDSHIIENYGIKLSGFHADTMHLARLWDSSRKIHGGYSLEALTSDPRVLSETEPCPVGLMVGKISMKSIFGKKKVKKDGSEGKLITIAPVEMLQKGEERIPWICYSVLDSISTLRLFESLKKKLMKMKWFFVGKDRGSMYDFYEQYWRPFGALLIKMESEGMLVDRDYLSEVEKVAIAEQQFAAERFRKWASEYCPDAEYMNVGSDAQLRQLFFGGTMNRKNENETLPDERQFKVANIDNVIKDGKKTPSKYHTITLKRISVQNLQTDMYTPSGWPSVSGDALRSFAGKIPTAKIFLTDDEYGSESSEGIAISYGSAYEAFTNEKKGQEACHAIAALCEVCSIDSLISNFILPLQGDHISGKNGRIHCSLNINTETGRLSARRPNLQNQPALEKDRYKIRQAFIAEPGNTLIVADYGQLELRILAHLANCKSMLDAFKAGGDFHSRTAMNMYDHVNHAVKEKRVLLEWYPQPSEDKPPVPLLKDVFGAERRKAKMLNFSIAYGKTPLGLSRDWKVSLKEARETVQLWYKERQEVRSWQEERKSEARVEQFVKTLLGRTRRFPSVAYASNAQRGHIERAAINTPVQGSAADVAMCAMLEIDRNIQLKELGWKLLLQVHDEVILEGPTESAEIAKAIVVDCMSKPFNGTNILSVDLSVDAKCAQNWYAAK